MVGKITRLRYERLIRGMAMKELALRVGCSYSDLSKYEIGKLQLTDSMSDRICSALDLRWGTPLQSWITIGPIEVDRVETLKSSRD